MDKVEELLKKQEDFEKMLAAQEYRFQLLNRETVRKGVVKMWGWGGDGDCQGLGLIVRACSGRGWSCNQVEEAERKRLEEEKRKKEERRLRELAEQKMREEMVSQYISASMCARTSIVCG